MHQSRSSKFRARPPRLRQRPLHKRTLLDVDTNARVGPCKRITIRRLRFQFRSTPSRHQLWWMLCYIVTLCGVDRVFPHRWISYGMPRNCARGKALKNLSRLIFKLKLRTRAYEKREILWSNLRLFHSQRRRKWPLKGKHYELQMYSWVPVSILKGMMRWLELLDEPLLPLNLRWEGGMSLSAGKKKTHCRDCT